MRAPLFHVDAFASGPFTGNPAAVCLLEKPADPAWMQVVAAEMNLSETAFVRPVVANEPGHFELRWFTPTVEVDLCGHATLASAHVLWETDPHTDGKPTNFETRSGTLTATRRGEGVELDFPADPVTAADPDTGLLDALGIADAEVSYGRIGWGLELPDADAVRAVSPDLARLAPFEIAVVTGRSADPRCDFVPGCFGSKLRIGEDPVAVPADFARAPYWAE